VEKVDDNTKTTILYKLNINFAINISKMSLENILNDGLLPTRKFY
jgi:hypothetical protein